MTAKLDCETMTAKHANAVEIYTDGACKGNPGIGGWGALLQYNGHTRELFGGEKLTTNNRMELLAVIRALEALKQRAMCACIPTRRMCRRVSANGYIHGKSGIGERRIKNL